MCIVPELQSCMYMIVWLISYMQLFTCIYLFKGPLTSFLEADPDLTKPPQFTAYSSDNAAGGRASPKPRPTASPTSSVGGNKGALFSDAEKKLLRYWLSLALISESVHVHVHVCTYMYIVRYMYIHVLLMTKTQSVETITLAKYQKAVTAK